MKSRKPLPLLTISLTTLAASLALFWVVNARSSTGNPVPAENLTPGEQIAEDVRKAIELNRAAENQAAWESSGYLPADILGKAVGLETDGIAGEIDALCDALSALPEENLALFEAELAAREKEIDCSAPLRAKLRRYWARAEKELRAKHRGQGREKTRVIRPMAPTLEIHVDAARGETIFGNAREGLVKEGQLAITIDDGPHPARTARILKALQEHGVRANFFSVGQMAKRFPDLVRQEVAEGHVVGSHSHDHEDMARLALRSIKVAVDNIKLGRDEVAAAAGVEVPFFRFPYGSRNAALTAEVAKLPMTSFLWNIDSSDWKLRNPAQLLQNMIRQLDAAKGGVLLIHDIQEQTAIALPHFLDELRARGIQPVVFVPH